MHNVSEIESIIKKVREKIKDYEGKKPEPGFNIFSVLGITRKEVIMTRFLADMLNPGGSHNKTDMYLRTFFSDVLRLEYSPNSYSVITEYPVPNNDMDTSKRIDLVIRTKDLFIPIEVKIDADDQKFQCCDYYNHMVNNEIGGDTLFYLTKDGKEPSDDSYGGLSEEEKKHIRCISFKNDIARWLDKIISHEDNELLRQVFMQYRDAIESFVSIMDREERETIQNCILTDPASMRAAIGISETINEAKTRLLENVFKDIYTAINDKFKSDSFVCEVGIDSDIFIERIRSFYYRKTSTCPYIQYKISGERVLKIVVDWNLYAGIDGDTQWVYLPFGGGKGSVNTCNFHDLNNSAIELVDEKKRKAFVEETIKTIEKFLNDVTGFPKA